MKRHEIGREKSLADPRPQDVALQSAVIRQRPRPEASGILMMMRILIVEITIGRHANLVEFCVLRVPKCTAPRIIQSIDRSVFSVQPILK